VFDSSMPSLAELHSLDDGDDDFWANSRSSTGGWRREVCLIPASFHFVRYLFLHPSGLAVKVRSIMMWVSAWLSLS
jgi:hypothetical protein